MVERAILVGVRADHCVDHVLPASGVRIGGGWCIVGSLTPGNIVTHTVFLLSDLIVLSLLVSYLALEVHCLRRLSLHGSFSNIHQVGLSYHH